MHKPTKARLHEMFEHDDDAGVLIWRTRPVEEFETVRGWKRWNSRYAGTVAGGLAGHGYREIQIGGHKRAAHRLIWIYINGDIPDGLQIDHINGKRDDNRVANLRLVTQAENGRNQSMPSDNSSGVMGVVWCPKRARKWRAQIMINGRGKHLGYFDTLVSAAAARAEADRIFGFHEGHGKSALAAHSAGAQGGNAE